MEFSLSDGIAVIDLAGFGVTLWLGLLLVTHEWGWKRGKVWLSALALWSHTLVFALGVYDTFFPVAGAHPEASLLRLLLWPLPMSWWLLSYGFLPVSIQARFRWANWLLLPPWGALLLVTLWTSLFQPELLRLSWVFLPLYALILLGALGAGAAASHATRSVIASTQERRARRGLLAATLLLPVAILPLLVDFVFGLDSSLVAPLLFTSAESTRTIASIVLLAASVALFSIILLQALAEGARPGTPFVRATLTTGVHVGVFLVVGGASVWYWRLPAPLMAVFIVLALLVSPIDRLTRSYLDRWMRALKNGAPRARRRGSEGQLVVERVPPHVRPLLSNLARQINSPQLALALPADDGYKIALALRPGWEGKALDVRDPRVWEERGLDGWNLPLKNRNGQTVGVLASEATGPLSLVQRQLLEGSAASLVHILEEWEALSKKREELQKVTKEYQEQLSSFDRHVEQLLHPVGAKRDLRKAVGRLLESFKNPAATIPASLTSLALVDKVLGPGQYNESHRSKVIRDTTKALIEQLRPFQGEPPNPPPVAWHPYLVAKRVYLEGEPEDEFMIRWKIPPRSYRKGYKAAVERIAGLLGELEAGAARSSQQTSAPAAPEPASQPTRSWSIGSLRNTRKEEKPSVWGTQHDPSPAGGTHTSSGDSQATTPLTTLLNRLRRQQGAPTPAPATNQEPQTTQRDESLADQLAALGRAAANAQGSSSEVKPAGTGGLLGQLPLQPPVARPNVAPPAVSATQDAEKEKSSQQLPGLPPLNPPSPPPEAQTRQLPAATVPSTDNSTPGAQTKTADDENPIP